MKNENATGHYKIWIFYPGNKNVRTGISYVDLSITINLTTNETDEWKNFIRTISQRYDK